MLVYCWHSLILPRLHLSFGCWAGSIARIQTARVQVGRIQVARIQVRMTSLLEIVLAVAFGEYKHEAQASELNHAASRHMRQGGRTVHSLVLRALSSLACASCVYWCVYRCDRSQGRSDHEFAHMVAQASGALRQQASLAGNHAPPRTAAAKAEFRCPILSVSRGGRG